MCFSSFFHIICTCFFLFARNKKKIVFLILYFHFSFFLFLTWAFFLLENHFQKTNKKISSQYYWAANSIYIRPLFQMNIYIYFFLICLVLHIIFSLINLWENSYFDANSQKIKNSSSFNFFFNLSKYTCFIFLKTLCCSTLWLTFSLALPAYFWADFTTRIPLFSAITEDWMWTEKYFWAIWSKIQIFNFDCVLLRRRIVLQLNTIFSSLLKYMNFINL